VIEEHYLSMLHDLLCMYVGEALELRVILNPNAPVQPAREIAPLVTAATSPAESVSNPQSLPSNALPPAWIDAERWEMLPIMLRVALAGSELIDGIVEGRTPFLNRHLHGRYTREVEELIAAAQ
jgi:hypothetical protein